MPISPKISFLETPSKINLFLKVTARRADGYHELESFFLPLSSPCDKVSMTELDAPGLRVTSNIPGLPEDAENLAGKAALAYADAAGLPPVWHFVIEKEIPIAAGMGGGSSDAACVLRLLNERYHLLSDEHLAEIALHLGADVPFFLNPSPAIATGVGEALRQVAPVAPGAALVLIAPGFPVSAKWAYAHLAPTCIGPDLSGRCEQLVAALHRGEWKEAAALIHNDLGIALFEKFPLLALLREFCCSHGALCCEVTGSGPVLFALMPDAVTAAALIAKGCSEFPEITFRTVTVAEQPLGEELP